MVSRWTGTISGASCFFFFQAEDGIRDLTVTGVQTCALPIFVEKLVERTKALKLGDPTERDVVFGPVINAAAVERFRRAVARARREGKIVLGGQQLGGEPFDHRHYLAPTTADLRPSSSRFPEERFSPIL